MYSKEQIEKAVKAKGYRWFENPNYDVNIVGVRNDHTDESITNKFDDLITVSFKDENGKWIFKEYEATTDPGKYYSQNKLLNKEGVAILKEGQYRGSHMIGLHQGRYEALKQKSKLKVYRDNDRDNTYDLEEENEREGIYGINIHRATSKKGGRSIQVDKWSAGCQVMAEYDDFEEFMSIMRKARAKWGNSFTYTLLSSDDLS